MSQQAAHLSYLAYQGFRWLKIGIVLALLSALSLAVWTYPAGNNGGTWTGYTLGTIGALLIVWLMWLGIRKRRYGAGNWSLKGWLSAHVYLGLALTVVATAHTGLEFGWNIHTLAYVLMMLVILSGIIGIIAYARVPALMTDNRRSQTLDQMAEQIVEIDGEAATLAVALSDEFASLVRMSQDETHIGGSFTKIISGRDKNCGTERAIARAREITRNLGAREAQTAAELVQTLGRKLELVHRARRDLRYKAIMDIWLYFHVPLSFALLITLTAHVIAVYFYWG